MNVRMSQWLFFVFLFGLSPPTNTGKLQKLASARLLHVLTGNIQRCRWVCATIKTIDRWLYPERSRADPRPSGTLPKHPGVNLKAAINIHCCRWVYAGTTHWSMNANCGSHILLRLQAALRNVKIFKFVWLKPLILGKITFHLHCNTISTDLKSWSTPIRIIQFRLGAGVSFTGKEIFGTIETKQD